MGERSCYTIYSGGEARIHNLLVANIKHGGDRKSDQAANLPLEISQPEAAKLLNVSERTVHPVGLANPCFRADKKGPGETQASAKGSVAIPSGHCEGTYS